MDGSWSGFADVLSIKDEVPDHTAEPVKDIILSNAASLDKTLAEDKYKQNLRKLEIVPNIRRNGDQRRLTSLVPLGRILVKAKHLGGRYAFNGSNKAEIECSLQAMAAHWSVCTITMEPQTFDLPVPESSVRRLRVSTHTLHHPGELNRLDKKI